MPDHELLQTIERYYDSVPRTAAAAERLGPLTLFVATGGWPYYARPTRGLDEPVHADDVARVRERQRALEVPESFEWVAEVTPTLAAAAQAAGLTVHSHPLLVLPEAALVAPPAPDAVVVRRLDADDPDLARAHAVAAVAFEVAGTRRGDEGAAERDLAAGLMTPEDLAHRRERMRRGLSVSYVAESPAGPVGVGTHQPVDGVSEVVGVATLPAERRRGIAGAVTAALARDARDRGCGVVFLSAGDDDVARVYARLGFVRVATACIAEPG